MTQYSKKQKLSPQTQAEAMNIAKSTQRPGQSKEQTKLIAQGIQKGIDQYKKQQKSRARERDKKLKTVSKRGADKTASQIEREVIYKQHWLPWVLLIASWIAIALLFFK